MALEMKETSRWWYARIMVNGKLRRFPLMEKRGGKMERIEVKGTRPASMLHPETGDTKFVESFHRARVAHDRLIEEELSKKNVEEQAQRIIEAKTGTRLDFVKVEALPELWEKTLGEGDRSPRYLATMKGKLARFAKFMSARFPKVEELCAVGADQLTAFLEEETKRGVSARTWNIAFGLLKSVFKEHAPTADAFKNLLAKKKRRKKEHTIHRAPFTEDEIGAIMEEARADEELRGPIVTAVCTAMRRGDCACLKWANVNLEEGFIKVPTSKTGEMAEIPILPALREELNRPLNVKSEFVFPAAAKLYQKNPHDLDRRLRLILGRAGFVDAERGGKTMNGDAEGKPGLLKLPPDEVRRRGLEAIAAGEMIDAKRERMKAIFSAYMDRKGLPTIARELGLSKSTVSLHLNEIEDRTGVAVLRRHSPRVVPAVIRGLLNQENGTDQRLKRGSIRGWHSFRVAFVTRALSGGMPEELVRRVTGHTAVDVVREHYFNPGRKEFRREFEKAMPELLMNGAKSRDEQLLEIMQGMTAKTWRQDKARLLALMAGKTGAAS
jgi:integrase